MSVLVPVIAPPKNPVPEKYPLPCMESNDAGLVVPMPTLPPLVAKYAEPVELIWVVEALPRVVNPVTESVEVAVSAPPKNEEPLTYALPCTLSNEVGLVVPMPS